MTRVLNILKIFVGLLLFQTQAFSATVTKIKKSTVTIDEGKGAGFTKGTKVCIFSDSGKKLACGKVRKSSKNKAMIKFSKKGRKRLKKVKKGFDAQIAGGVRSSSPSGKNLYGMSVRGLYTPAIMSPVSYNKVVYDGAAAEEGASSLWTSQGEASSTLLSGGLEFELASLGLGLGFRYTSFQSFQADSDYDETNFARVLIESSTIGLWADYNYAIILSKSSQIRVSGGLDFAMSTVDLEAQTIATEEGGSGEGVFAKTSSSLNSIGLRIGTNYDMYFKPFGITAGLNLIIPVAGEASGSPEVTDDVNGNKVSSDLGEDLTAALDHKGAMGVQLLIGTFMGF